MHIEQLTASPDLSADPSTGFHPGSAQSTSQPIPPPALTSPSVSPTWSSAIAHVGSLDGRLIAIGTSDIGVELAAGDAVGEGDVLIAGADTRALIVFEDGATVTIDGIAQAEIHADQGLGGMHGRIVVRLGSLVVDATAAGGDLGDTHSSFAVETAAATLHIDDAAVALSYARPTGLEAILLSNGASADGGVTIVNDSGDFILDHLHWAVAVDTWIGAPRLVGAPDWGDFAEKALSAPVNPGFAEAAPADAVDGDISFETGAGTASPGDVSFIFPQPFSQGLADHPAMTDMLASPMPQASIAPAPPSPHEAAFAASGHAPDALFLYVAPPHLAPPASPSEPPPPSLTGWEPSGHSWAFLGAAGTSSGARELPADPQHPLELITPLEGITMAALEPRHAMRSELEQFLGLPDSALNTLVEGAHVFDGSAIRTQFNLQAGQTLSFGVLFDAVDTLPKNDFAAFTVADGGHGEAFVISSVAATGSLGATPWQSIRYTAGHSGPVTIGFVIINDDTIHGLSHLYIDGWRAGEAAGGGGDTYELAAGRDGPFGGRFELFAPASPTGGEQVLASFEAGFGLNDRIGQVSTANAFHEPDGARGLYTPTDGESMAVLRAYGASRPALEAFLNLHPNSGSVSALPMDVDGSASNTGAATRLSLSVAAGDHISFDWMFDAGDQLPDNDYAIFSVADDGGSQLFKLSDVRQTGAAGASGWQTSVYTAAESGELTLGFAVINDRLGGYSADDDNSRLLVDNVRLNRDFGDGYQLVDLPAPGALETLAAV